MSLAQRNYQHLWNQVAALYGQAGTKAPMFNPVPKGHGAAYVPYNPDGTPQRMVNINPSDRRQLKQNPDAMQFTALHEWGHVFGAGNEGNANRVANLATRDLRGKLSTKIARRKIRNTLNVAD